MAQFNIRYSLHGERCENTLYFFRTTGWAPSTLLAHCSYLANWFTTGPRAQLVDDLVLREVYGVDLTSQNASAATQAIANDPGGPHVQEGMPNNVALCISFRTPNRGRSYRGRNYISGFHEGQVTGNVISSTVAEAIRAAYQILIDDGEAGSPQWCVVSRYSNKLPRAVGIYTLISAVVVTDVYVDSMRRRLPGRGA